MLSKNRNHLKRDGALLAGLRALRWQDVDFANKQIQVRQRADKFNEIGSPKSEASWRSIPIGPTLVSVLREWQAESLKWSDKNKLGLVFCNGAGNTATIPLSITAFVNSSMNSGTPSVRSLICSAISRQGGYYPGISTDRPFNVVGPGSRSTREDDLLERVLTYFVLADVLVARNCRITSCGLPVA